MLDRFRQPREARLCLSSVHRGWPVSFHWRWSCDILLYVRDVTKVTHSSCPRNYSNSYQTFFPVAQLVERALHLKSVRCGFESHVSAAFSLERVVSGLVLLCVALCCFVFLSLFLSFWAFEYSCTCTCIYYYLPPCTAWCSSWWLLGNGWSIRTCSDQGVLNRHCAMYMYMYIHSALSSIEFLFSVCAVEGGGCSDGCDSGAHPQGAHSQWQSF